MKLKLILIPFVLLLASFLGLPSVALAQSPTPSSVKKPNILVASPLIDSPRPSRNSKER